MTKGREAAGRPARAPLQQRSRKRWAVAGGIAACWVVLAVMTGSVLSATVALVIIAGLGALTAGGLRALGITMDHPWLRRVASRPWRDGQDVLKVAMRHLSDVFVVTPNGALLAPNVVELQLNRDDLASLCERMELGVIGSSMTEVYQEKVAEYRARFAGPGPADVYVIAAEAIPPGRYRLRQADRMGAGAARIKPDLQYPMPDLQYPEAAPELAYAAPQAAYGESGARVWHAPDPGPGPDQELTSGVGLATIMEWSLPRIPVLRLITGSSVAETKMSGARAGRGSVELVLPDVPTVSREHATFTFSGDRWRITNQGRNGLTLNDVPVAGEQPLSDGDEIRWGTRPDALLTRVEIG